MCAIVQCCWSEGSPQCQISCFGKGSIKKNDDVQSSLSARTRRKRKQCLLSLETKPREKESCEKESPALKKDDNGEIIVKKETKDCEESNVKEEASGGIEKKVNDTEDSSLFHPHSYWPRVKLQHLENIVRTNMEIKIRTLDQLQEEDNDEEDQDVRVNFVKRNVSVMRS